MASPSDSVCIVVSDISRAYQKMSLFLPYVIRELEEAGVPDEQITLLCALGAHSPQSEEENAWFWEDFTADFGLWSMTAGMKRIWFIWEQHAMERRSVFPVTRRRRIWLS